MFRSSSLIVFTLTLAFQLVPAASATAGKVYSFGWNGGGRTGLGISENSSTIVATRIGTSNLGGRGVAQVAANIYHSLLLAEDGTVFSFGSNLSGKTGLAIDDVSITTVATPIDTSNLGGRAIKQVSAGVGHSLLLAEDGTVLSFGSNVTGQTGLGVSDISVTSIATPIDTSNLGGQTITQVSAGGSHSLLLTESGNVYSFGSNSLGRTGLGRGSGITTIATPIDTSNMGGRAIKQVSAGAGHSLLLAEDGTVFSFGQNLNGQAGIGTVSLATVATPIDTSNLGGRGIKQVSAGERHSLLLAEDGTVFSFGLNARALTGLGIDEISFTRVATPIDASNLGGRTIAQVSAAYLHSLLLAEDGTVFSFGDNSFGRTGLGIDEHSSTLLATPIDTSNLGGRAVTQVSAGGDHSLLIAVPEPAAFVLAGFALLSLFGVTRRR